MEAVRHRTRDGVGLRLARWPAGEAAVGTVLLLNGRTEFVEKYEETARDLVARRLHVWSLDWRGQGLSDRLLADRERGHLTDYAVLVEDLAEVVADRVTDTLAGRPLLLLAHSMGGHVALRYLAERNAPAGRPERVRAAVLTAPMAAILPGGPVRWSVRVAARLAVGLGRSEAYAPRQRGWREDDVRFAGNALTGDAGRFAIYAALVRERPELRLGGVTWGWLDATLRSSRDLLRPDFAQGIDVPVLIARAGRETVVNGHAIGRLARRLPRAGMRTYQDSRHEILMESDAVRNAFWQDFGGFLSGLDLEQAR